jgi:hypothetical protein
VRSLQHAVAVGDGVEKPRRDSPLEDGEQDLVIYGLHDILGPLPRLQGDSIKGLASTISSTLEMSLEGITGTSKLEG